MRGRSKLSLILSEAEHEQLTTLAVRRETSQAVALRARIALACTEGIDNKTVATKQRVCLVHGSRSGVRDSSIIARTSCSMHRALENRGRLRTRWWMRSSRTRSNPYPPTTHWSTRTMAREMGMSQAVPRI